jgi:hypothetical protein
METIMRKSYSDYSVHKPVWVYMLVVLGLLWLVTKPFFFPLLLIAGFWWAFSRGACGMRWHHRDWHSESGEKPKRKNDWNEDDDYTIV